jgi:hypothetical protein
MISSDLREGRIIVRYYDNMEFEVKTNFGNGQVNLAEIKHGKEQIISIIDLLNTFHLKEASSPVVMTQVVVVRLEAGGFKGRVLGIDTTGARWMGIVDSSDLNCFIEWSPLKETFTK